MKQLIWTVCLAGLLIGFTGCGSEDEPAQEPCGNGRIDEGEQCDGAAPGADTCQSLGFSGGTLGCGSDCRYDTSLCESEEPCGNGELDAGEECDGELLDDKACADFEDFVGGELACTKDCTFDTSACRGPEACNNGLREGDEACDGQDFGEAECPDFGFDGGELTCSQACGLIFTDCTCADDDFEPNDAEAEAAALSVGAHALEMCNRGGAEDWFSFTLPAGEMLAMSLSGEGLWLDVIGPEIIWRDETGHGWAIAGDETLESQVLIRIMPSNDLPGVIDYQLQLQLDPICVRHEECPVGQLCQDFSCQDYTCDEDNLCPGDWICDGGDCVECAGDGDCIDHPMVSCQEHVCEFTCTEDDQAPNAGPEEAAPIASDFSASELRLCQAGAEDWFSVELAALHLLRVALDFDHAAGDLDVFLYGPDDLQSPLAAGISMDDDESFSFAVPADGAGTYLLQVRLADGGLGQQYALALSDEGAVECVFDADCAVEDEVCLDYACAVPECVDDDDCDGEQRCVDHACADKPDGDDCDGAIVIDQLPFDSGPVSIDAYRPAVSFVEDACSEWGTEGKDVIYRINLTAGQQLTAMLTSSFDAALVLSDACSAEPLAAEHCLGASDDGLANEMESVTHTADSDGEVYLVVDTSLAYAYLTGTFELFIQVD